MLLLDTCTLLWLAARQDQLSQTARQAIRDHADNLFVSSISAYEIGLKAARGALKLPAPPEEWFPEILAHHGVQEVLLSAAEGLCASALPRLHNDPFDRIIVATALLHGARVVTPDHLIGMYPKVQTVW